MRGTQPRAGCVTSAPGSHEPIQGLQQLRVRYTEQHVRLQPRPGHTLGNTHFVSTGGHATNAQLDVLFGLSPSSRPYSNGFRSEGSLASSEVPFPTPGRKSAARAARQRIVESVDVLPGGKIDHRWPVLLPPSNGPVRRATVAAPDAPPQHTLAPRGVPQPWLRQPSFDKAMPWSAMQPRPVTVPSLGLNDSKRWPQALDHLRHNHDSDAKVAHMPTLTSAKVATRMPEIVHCCRDWRSTFALQERHDAESKIATSWSPLKRGLKSRAEMPSWYSNGVR
jgi:hypothetical protein